MIQWYLQCGVDDCDCEADYILGGFSVCEGHKKIFRNIPNPDKKAPMYCGKCYQYYEKNCWCTNNPAKKEMHL